MYHAFLLEEGYSPKIDEDGDVVFKFEGGNYVILIDEDDEDYFVLLYPSFWSIESEEERAKVILAALQATTKTKVAKVLPGDDNTTAAIEMFCSPPEAIRPVFQRALRALSVAVRNFREAMLA